MSKPISARAFTIDLAPYQCTLLVSINQKPSDYRALLQGCGLEYYSSDEQDATVKAFVRKTEKPFYIAKFFCLDKSLTSQGTIAHEMFHVTEMMFSAVGIKHSFKYSSEAYEAYAYMFIHLVKKVNESI
jgi:hypothetical protein